LKLHCYPLRMSLVSRVPRGARGLKLDDPLNVRPPILVASRAGRVD